MPVITFHWLAADCCEATLGADTGPRLFRCLAAAGEILRHRHAELGTTSGFASLAVQWTRAVDDRDAAEQRIGEALTTAWASTEASTTARHHLPVRYDGPDLAVVAERIGLTPEAVIDAHRRGVYTVAAVGFMPHFAYLWGLDPALSTPRRSSPRARVPLGALGIAGTQTAVYPCSSPGGWQLIGQLPAAACAVLLPRLAVGDEVIFEALA